MHPLQILVIIILMCLMHILGLLYFKTRACYRGRTSQETQRFFLSLELRRCDFAATSQEYLVFIYVSKTFIIVIMINAIVIK